MAMQQYILIAGGLAVVIGGLVAMFLMRPGPGDGPQPIADPYEDLYSHIRGEVVARPLGERHAGVGRDELDGNGALRAAQTPREFHAPDADREAVRPDEDDPSWRDQANGDEPLWSDRESPRRAPDRPGAEAPVTATREYRILRQSETDR
jgi:hypothetical protein